MSDWQRLLIWLGKYRDHVPQDGVVLLQELADMMRKRPQSDEEEPETTDYPVTTKRGEINRLLCGMTRKQTVAWIHALAMQIESMDESQQE